MPGVLLPNGGSLYGEAVIDPDEQPWVEWQDAGGAVPSLGAISVFGSGTVAPTLAPSPVIDSTFASSGNRCDATVRIHGTGTGSLTGALVIEGLPVAPQYQGVVGEGGQNIGYGFLISGTANTKFDVKLVIDPTFDETLPMVWLNTGIDTDGSAGGARAASLTSFGGNPNVFVAGNSPFDWNGTEFYLNLTLRYQGVA